MRYMKITKYKLFSEEYKLTENTHILKSNMSVDKAVQTLASIYEFSKVLLF